MERSSWVHRKQSMLLATSAYCCDLASNSTAYSSHLIQLPIVQLVILDSSLFLHSWDTFSGWKVHLKAWVGRYWPHKPQVIKRQMVSFFRNTVWWHNHYKLLWKRGYQGLASARVRKRQGSWVKPTTWLFPLIL